MIRALIGSLCAAIVVLAITAICLWGWGQRNENKAIRAERSLEVEQGVSKDLRINLQTAQNSNTELAGQLQRERQLLQEYQAKTASLNKELLMQKEAIRILEREDKEFYSWSNTLLPISVVGLLTDPETAGNGGRNQN